MKRAKKLVTIATIATITLGSVVSVFADDAKAPAATTATTAVVATETKAVEEVKAPVVEEKKYDDLGVSEKHYYNDRRDDLGVYPVVKGTSDDITDLNKKIEDGIFKAYYFTYSTDSDTAYQLNTFSVSYKVEDCGQYAKISVTYHYNKSTIKTQPYEEVANYYVDKATMKEVAMDVYDKAVADAEAAATDAPAATDAAATTTDAAAPTTGTVAAATGEKGDAAEVSMIPLRKYALTLGCTIQWDAAKSLVLVYKDDKFCASFKAGVNLYTVGSEPSKEIELSAAPSNEDGTMYVPVDFFEKILGAKVTIAADGAITVKAGDTVAPAEAAVVPAA